MVERIPDIDLLVLATLYSLEEQNYTDSVIGISHRIRKIAQRSKVLFPPGNINRRVKESVDRLVEMEPCPVDKVGNGTRWKLNKEGVSFLNRSWRWGIL